MAQNFRNEKGQNFRNRQKEKDSLNISNRIFGPTQEIERIIVMRNFRKRLVSND